MGVCDWVVPFLNVLALELCPCVSVRSCVFVCPSLAVHHHMAGPWGPGNGRVNMLHIILQIV